MLRRGWSFFPSRQKPPVLGVGWQYTVYDLGDGRVLKVPLSREQRMRIAFAEHRNDPAFTRERAAAWADAVAVETRRSYGVLEGALPDLDARLLAYPLLLGNDIYEQDKVLIVANFFRDHSFAENAAIVDRYVETTRALWQWGISDVVFNFAVNSGIAADGAVVLCDLGELTTAQTWVRQNVARQIWLRSASFSALRDARLASYIPRNASPWRSSRRTGR
jgi:hypothetical protein